ncbi:MAG: ZIP family metal transporter [Clostridia bacterium]
MFWKVVILSTIAGAIGTGLGGLLGCLIKGNNKRTTSLLFSFAGGIMLGIVFFDLIPELMPLNRENLLLHFFLAIIGIAIGMFFVFVFNSQIDKKLNLSKELPIEKRNNKKYFLSGLAIFASIALHNLPEGLVIGAGQLAEMGTVTTILIGIHNIPEGMAIALPMKLSGTSTPKAVFYCILSGMPTIFGAIIGYVVGGVNDYIIKLCLGIASGAMLAIVFCEMLPMATDFYQNKTVSAIALIVGIIVAFGLVTFI